MSFKGSAGRNTEMSEDRVNGIISELIEKTKLLAEELRNSNRIATELMSANTQLRSEYSILKNKFLQFLNEDDLQDYIDNSNAYSHPSNSKLNQELEGLSQNKRALEAECANLTQELNECKSRLAQQEKQVKSYALLQDITANKDQEINNLQLQLQLLTTQLQSDAVKKQSSNLNTKLSLATVQSPSDASQRQYSSSKQEYLQYPSQQQGFSHEQQFQYSKPNQQQAQYPTQTVQNITRNQNTNSNHDLEHDHNNNSNLDGSSNEEIPGEVDIQNINKKNPVQVQQDRQYRAQSVSNNYELINEKPKKAAHQQSQSILPTSNTTLPLSTTNRTNISPLHQQNSNPAGNQQNNNSNIPLKNSNNGNQNMNNNLKKIRGILDHSESQPVIRSKTPNTAPYYARNFVANDFNELLYAEQPHREEQDYAQGTFTKNSNNFNNTDNLQFSNTIEQSNFNTQPNFFNSNFSDTKKQNGIQQLNYPPGNSFHNTAAAKQTQMRPPQMIKDPYPLEQSNEKYNPNQNYSNYERQNMNKNYESQPSSNSPYANNSNNMNDDRHRQDEVIHQQFIDPYKNSQQVRQQKPNNNSAAFDLQQVAQKNTRSGFLKKQQGGARNSSVTSNKWK